MVTYDYETPSGVARERFAHLPIRIVNILIRRGIRSWPQIAKTSDEDLLSLGKFGKVSLETVRKEQRYHMS
jgi:DNA-directed RNA polymerase alpha subunit